jgi:hypothetical protein
MCILDSQIQVSTVCPVEWLCQWRDEKDIIYPQQIMEHFEGPTVNKLSSSIISVSYLESRKHTNLWSGMLCILRSFQSLRKSLGMEGSLRYLLVSAIYSWQTKSQEQISMVKMQEMGNLRPKVLQHRMILDVRWGLCLNQRGLSRAVIPLLLFPPPNNR